MCISEECQCEGMCGNLCLWRASVSEPREILFHILTHSRGKDIHTSFALTETDGAAKAMMMQIWTKCVLSFDLVLEVAGYV